MNIRMLVLLLVSAMFGAGAATAKPVSVDCGVLEGSINAVDAYLDANETQFASLGDLISLALLDAESFAGLNQLLVAFSGGQLEPFASAQSLIASVAKCGGIKNLIDQIND